MVKCHQEKTAVWKKNVETDRLMQDWAGFGCVMGRRGEDY